MFFCTRPFKLHNWADWTVYETDSKFDLFIKSAKEIGMEVPAQNYPSYAFRKEERQKRSCQDCGHTQDVSLRDIG